MGYIVWGKGEEAFVQTVLLGGAVSPAIPTVGANWGLGLAATTGGVWAGAGAVSIDLKQRAVGTNVSTTIAEIGQVGTVNNGGYGRIGIQRNSTGWPTVTNSSNTDNWSATTAQKTWSFTSGGPNMGGGSGSAATTLWMICKSTTAWTNTSTPTDDLMFGADLATSRAFATGDTENITVTYKQS